MSLILFFRFLTNLYINFLLSCIYVNFNAIPTSWHAIRYIESVLMNVESEFEPKRKE